MILHVLDARWTRRGIERLAIRGLQDRQGLRPDFLAMSSISCSHDFLIALDPLIKSRLRVASTRASNLTSNPCRVADALLAITVRAQPARRIRSSRRPRRELREGAKSTSRRRCRAS